MTREGGSIPVTLSLQKASNKNVMLLPMGACDDSAHSQNEKMNRSNYINGVRMICRSWLPQTHLNPWCWLGQLKTPKDAPRYHSTL